MRNKPIKHATILALAGLCGVVFLQTSSRADTVLPGYDLFTTDPSTSFDGLNWAGVPLSTPSGGPNTYNFGGSIGVQYVGLTDTIMQRLGTWNSTTPGNPPISLQMDALQFASTTPMFGPGVYGYITLDPGYTSGGTVTINSDGTYSTSFNVYFDIHEGSLTGPMYGTVQDLALTGSGAWQHPPTPGGPTITISGVNYWLDGTDTSEDFWPDINGAGGPFTESASAFSESHVFSTSDPIPEPSGLALLGLGMLCLAIKTRRGRK
jgi:hypothetical protein